MSDDNNLVGDNLDQDYIDVDSIDGLDDDFLDSGDLDSDINALVRVLLSKGILWTISIRKRSLIRPKYAKLKKNYAAKFLICRLTSMISKKIILDLYVSKKIKKIFVIRNFLNFNHNRNHDKRANSLGETGENRLSPFDKKYARGISSEVKNIVKNHGTNVSFVKNCTNQSKSPDTTPGTPNHSREVGF